jgi:formylglycine-generating enzyme required for sulfatase activity
MRHRPIFNSGDSNSDPRSRNRWTRIATVGVACFAAASLGLAPSASSQCIQGDVNGDGVVNGIDLSIVLTNWGQTCPAVITSVAPSLGLPAGGTAITITGSQLGGVLGVTVGGVPATQVVGVDATTITAVTPPSKSVGPKDVVVTTTASTATLAGGFTYSQNEEWAAVLEMLPDPAVVTNESLRAAIIATGLPWRVQDNASGIEMLLVPSGTFMMGCSPSNQYGCNVDENPVHEVTLTQPFYLGRYEVTQAQWTAVMGSNPSSFQGPSSQVPAEQVPNRPVERVSWNMIQGFEVATGLRLPTEAEWEYACRAGTMTAFNLPPDGTNDDGLLGQLAWFSSNAASQTRPVGQKQANNLGLHDMHGNVWEWVEDWDGIDYYSQSPPIDPPGPISGTNRVLRGGSWANSSFYCRASYRASDLPVTGFSNDGFRVARTP